jgi:hypothetical protein
MIITAKKKIALACAVYRSLRTAGVAAKRGAPPRLAGIGLFGTWILARALTRDLPVGSI